MAVYAWWLYTNGVLRLVVYELEERWLYVHMYVRERRMVWTRGFENKSALFQEIQPLQFFLFST